MVILYRLLNMVILYRLLNRNAGITLLSCMALYIVASLFPIKDCTQIS